MARLSAVRKRDSNVASASVGPMVPRLSKLDCDAKESLGCDVEGVRAGRQLRGERGEGRGERKKGRGGEVMEKVN